ncbi:amidase family protein [Mesoplasma photuris]|uniref:amidase family protein n=1 Tax=Mesoplasma photuris TaxID=217731 RepID=UPI0004E23525|nr:amidase family protein [Mesoplasma photuris]
MNYKDLTILELHEAIVSGKIKISEITKDALKEIESEKSSNAFLAMNESAISDSIKLENNLKDNLDNFLYGIPYLAKDNFSTKGIVTTSSSKILENYIPPYNSTIVDDLEQKGSIMLGKTALDELGMGGTGLHSAFGIITNPKDPKRLVGGSSSGSVYAVSKGIVPFATGSDTGDSIRKPASYNGVVGFKPSYGALSRYGLLAYAPSLDTAGFFTKTVDDMAIVSDATIRNDKKDFTSIDIENKNFFENIDKLDKKTTFAYLDKVHDALPIELKEKYESFYKKIESLGYKVSKVDFRKDLLEAIDSVYMMISFSEGVSTNANLAGIHFGSRVDGEDFVEIMTKTRSEKFGNIVKRRFLIGSFNLRKENQIKYLLQAKKVRRLIIEEVMKVLNKFDILILPPATGPAPLIEKAQEFEDKLKEAEFLSDILIIANFAGLPSITIPFIEMEGMPVGINLNSKPKADLKVLQAAKLLESLTNGGKYE